MFPDCDCGVSQDCPGEGRFTGDDWRRFWQVVGGLVFVGIGVTCLVVALTAAGAR